MNILEALKELKNNKGINIDKLAKELKLGRRTIYTYINETSRPNYLTQMGIKYHFLKYYGIDIDLLDDTELYLENNKIKKALSMSYNIKTKVIEAIYIYYKLRKNNQVVADASTTDDDNILPVELFELKNKDYVLEAEYDKNSIKFTFYKNSEPTKEFDNKVCTIYSDYTKRKVDKTIKDSQFIINLPELGIEFGDLIENVEEKIKSLDISVDIDKFTTNI